MKKLFILLWIVASIVSCKHQETEEADVSADDIQTPVTITTVSTETLAEYVDLTAVSSYLQANYIKSSANAYIKAVNVKPGQFVRTGQVAFVLQTKEARALGNTINKLDPSFHFSGLIPIKATQTGFITSLDHQAGDYVQDGEQLAVLSDAQSFGFVLNLPYELHSYLAGNKTVDLELPDKRHLKGYVARLMPAVDSASQTQGVLIKVEGGGAIPQNLIAKVRIVKNQRSNVISLPKDAVLTDESQSNFWVMKMIDSVTAVKTPIVKGMETADRVEVLRPVLTVNDKIVLNGNYGLPDTAKVRVQH